jgi:NitT/TauT family transport system substrate-binding protein
MTAAIMVDAVPEQWQDLDVGYQLAELSAYTLHEPMSERRGDLHPALWERVQPTFVSVGEISQTHDVSTFLDDSFIAAANEYTMEELEADVAAWIEANGDRYAAVAR